MTSIVPAYDLESLRVKVRERKLCGKSYHEIANELNITAERAFALCADGFVMPTNGRAQALERGVQAARLDMVLGKVIDILEEEVEPETKLKAIAQFVSIESRRAKLLGLDAPERMQALVATFDGAQEQDRDKPTPAKAAEKMRAAFGLVGPKVKDGD